ncbi:MAG: Uma2 family endonuclease [Deltaproteobacteria bacterium]|nr:Uma2 family endonuclease [Deltaproteobacteria bacterium]
MAAPALRRATYQDVLDAPAHKVAEIVDGELFLNPRPTIGHGYSSGALFAGLHDPFGKSGDGPGGWIFIIEPELHFGRGEPDVLVPDIAGWRRERLPTIDPDAPFSTLAPDWVCETLSPSTARLDRVRKLPIYARHGVPFCWLIDPAARTLETLELDKKKTWRLTGAFADDARVKAKPFDAVTLDLSTLWSTFKTKKKTRKR